MLPTFLTGPLFSYGGLSRSMTPLSVYGYVCCIKSYHISSLQESQHCHTTSLILFMLTSKMSHAFSLSDLLIQVSLPILRGFVASLLWEILIKMKNCITYTGCSVYTLHLRVSRIKKPLASASHVTVTTYIRHPSSPLSSLIGHTSVFAP